MKKILFTLMCLGIGMSLNAQSASNYYHNYDRHYDDRYDDRRDSRDYDRYRSDYRSYNSAYRGRYLPIEVRNELRNLERKLAHRKKCAWEDGRISRREARRIRDVERDIAQLLYRYSSNRYTTRRSNRYCR